MATEINILILTAFSIGFFHTLLGPDHYLPFIVMAKSGKWSLKKATIVTILCGFGHVLSSVVLGLAGISLGIALQKLEFIESFRGNLAAWGLISFGLLYFLWGVQKIWRNKPHTHTHAHDDGELHTHAHTHHHSHLHAHGAKNKKNMTPWVLFVIFLFGPCEPLIPILMYPAAKSSLTGLTMVTLAFGLTTIITMTSIVLISTFGLNLVPFSRFEKYSHALAGATIFLSGIAVQFLGL